MLRLMPVALALVLAPAAGGPKAFMAQAPEVVSPQPPLAPPPSAGEPLVIDQARDGLFYLEAKVNGAPVRFVVDSGASVVILNAADAARAGVVSHGGVSVDTAGGSAPMHRARLQRLALAGQDLADVDAVIVQRDLDVSLLGQSALSQMRSITFRGSQLELR
ncbi:retropepsin-like aspartic protease family protein [Sphingomonas sp.]|uniref:retropepsin-like aspartic protease family protein n=1 Tax=Sphingomonas sp. TaxID=28214 RepID=UPI003CC69868